MFNIGDKVVYPMHGAGIIEGIEENEIAGNSENYYIIKMPVDDVKVMVPTNKASDIGVREISDETAAEKVFSILEQPMEPLSCDSNWNKRYNSNIDKIKSGSLEEVTQVFKDLSHRHMVKGLSLGEKKMLTTSKNILLSELVLVRDGDKASIDIQLEDIVKLSFEKGQDITEDVINT